MTAWRVPLVLLLASASLGYGQKADLAEAVKPGDCFDVSLSMKLAGEIRIKKDDGPATLKLSASADHAFREKVVAAEGASAQRVVRLYSAAKAEVNAGSDKTERTLREKRRLIVAQRHKDQRLSYCPAGALTRSEIEVVDHFDTLAVAAVLPGKEAKAGEAWKVPVSVAGALCNLEGVTEAKLEGKLVKVEGDRAQFAVSGKVSGVESGAMVKASVEAEGVFDLKAKRLVKLEWGQKDERDLGPVSPAGTMEVKVSLSRKQADLPAELSDVALVSVPNGFAPPAEMTHVEHRDAKGRYLLLHARDWQMVAVTADHAVLRLVERGDFLAQATVAHWGKAKKGKRMTPEEFRDAMSNTTGWRAERVVQEGEVPGTDGKHIYRLSMVGQLDGLAVMQNFFLVSNEAGEQVVVTFTMSPKNAEKLGARDLSLAGSLEIPAPKR
ncbi:MAG: hypothetical protein K2W96_09660 [Gemmataceae bacterium]|nr:hypothetical protein [Gemmataceae bacterium]